MKKAKFFIFHELERFVLKSGKNENQQFPGNPPNIENLFEHESILISLKEESDRKLPHTFPLAQVANC